MDIGDKLIIAKGENISLNVSKCYYSDGKYEITFKNGKKYTYNCNNIKIVDYYVSYDPSLYRIVHNGRELFDIINIKEFVYLRVRFWRITFGNGKVSDYYLSELEIYKSVLDDKTSSDCLQFLCEMADLNDLTDEEGNKILVTQYKKLKKVYNNTVLARYLNPNNKENKIPETISRKESPVIPIFPFGCNQSQYNAVINALNYSVSIIEGPPGTGKTQTILNLIANIVVSGRTVQVVSNNNAATDNVFEKTSQDGYSVDFIAARLGSVNNKELFVSKQDEKYPPFLGWQYSGDKDLQNEIKNLSSELKDLYAKKQELAELKRQNSALNTEFEYYKIYCSENNIDTDEVIIKHGANPERIIRLIQSVENSKRKSVLTAFKGLYRCRIGKRSIYRKGKLFLIAALRYAFYVAKLAENSRRIEELDGLLDNADFSEKESRLKNYSILLLKDYLFKRYSGNIFRTSFNTEDIYLKSADFLKEYPVVLSTTFSALNSVYEKFDYVIIDEASQADIATGALALCSAENAVVVGDSCQLPFVLSNEKKNTAKIIFNSYNISNSYDYSSFSFLDSVKKVFKDSPVTTLREHYRCNPKIIEFCNQKFYNGQLLIMTEERGSSPVGAIRTVSGNHARGRYNQRQIDVIVKEVLPSLDYLPSDIGIIAPYNEQIAKIKEAVCNEDIKVSTVHKFQGREKKVIIFSTVDNEIKEFVDNPKLLNVAVSRAAEKFIIITGNEINGSNNIKDLISYIEYNNFEITESTINSVFDLLYQANTEERIKYLSGRKKVSEYDSENLMYAEITDLLSDFSELNVACHVPLDLIIREKTQLNTEEAKYVENPLTHVGFLIYNKVSKKPVLIIEVDGFHFHRTGTKQAERDKMKDSVFERIKLNYLRLPTNGSDEKEKIYSKLNKIIN